MLSLPALATEFACAGDRGQFVQCACAGTRGSRTTILPPPLIKRLYQSLALHRQASLRCASTKNLVLAEPYLSLPT
eukprot:1158109-Pelagomonas_calceolata.AAC.12